MVNWFRRTRPPMRSGGAVGLKRDADFAPRGPSVFGRLFARGSDGRAYWMDERDAKRLRPTITRDPRAVANEKAKAERLDRLRRAGAPLVLDESTGEYELEPPNPEILPAAKRPAPDAGLDVDWIMPPGAASGGHH
jgi:hypothetical protein